ncbi:BTB/POZ domain-containing protein 17-like isoform X2 [Sipha flava]|uniref:BTB/POZ domain-containing protein 17-like isoform X2 n=1 Tax=Sipha flava TaxID=143950 RepID=A0A8B8GM34_9HEMI|nr:BTB/POZ domain-containing protein 17-like isoform X2 [Sipha flava]
MKRRRMSTEYEMDHSYAMPNVNDNSNALLKKIQNVYVNRLLTDITLVVGGVSYPAHRFMLCISSDVFESMLMNSKRSDSHQNVIELQEVPLCIEVFPLFLQYFYTGEITLEHNNIMPMLVLADKYNVKDLTVLCVEYMCEHIADAANQGQLVTWFQYVLSINQPMMVNAAYFCKIWQDTECIKVKPLWNKLFKACRNFIKWNIDTCVDCFNTFQCDVLVGLLKQSDLVVLDEIQLFKYVVSWLNYQTAKKLTECNDSDTVEEYRISLTEHVMSYIRYPMIPPRIIAQLLVEPVLKQNMNFFVEKMAAAMEYNMIKKEKQSNAKNLLECTPRLYTCPRWGDEFSICQKSIKDFLSVKKEITTNSDLFERDQEKPDRTHWNVELFLKGLWFGKALWISWSDSLVLPEMIVKMVRATIELKLKKDEKMRTFSYLVRVAILVYALQNKITHVVSVVQKVVLFNNEQVKITIDDFMVYDAINRPKTNINDTNVSYIIYESLKFHVIITPIVPGLTDTHIGTRIQHVHF